MSKKTTDPKPQDSGPRSQAGELAPMKARRQVRPVIEPAAKRALLERHGGLGGASDEDLAGVWRSLTPGDRERYLNPSTEEDEKESGD